MVKELLQAHEVRRLYCAQMIKEKLIWYVQRLKCSNFQHYTCRHAELDEQITDRRAASVRLFVFFFYLSLGLVRVCEIEISHMKSRSGVREKLVPYDLRPRGMQ